ncbi:MAG: peptidyl-prolyl cis-trans isomerase [Planctomycetes bacterium]|nr:peptidyl-prolyl cis-trans isomerase [Planctomycetota bacterium]
MKKSPLFHIVLFGCLLGIILVVVFGRPSAVDDDTRVVVSASDIAQMSAGWMRRWMREPTPVELRGLVESFVHDEVLYREAVRRGYDKDDSLIRQTMRLKMEYLGEAQAQKVEPSLEEMQAYYAMRKERYRVPATASFVHIYFNQDKRGDKTEMDAKQTLERVITDNSEVGELSDYGDRFMLKDHYVGQDELQIRKDFGENFAQQIVSLTPGTWQGPILSGYGFHLVKVYERQEAYLPEIKEIEYKIRNDMDFENRKAAKQLFYTEILRNYQVEYDSSIKGLLGQGG